MNKSKMLICLAAALGCAAAPVWGVTPNADELASAGRWALVKFGGVRDFAPLGPGLEAIENHDPVHKDMKLGKPLRIGDKEYARGLFCHAPSRIVVHLPGPGKAFTAVAGIENNTDTANGQGSIRFLVRVGADIRFESDVFHGGDAGVPVNVDLGGATEFVLEINDAGDGISSDQGDWAEAQVTLENGQTVVLSDLPMPSTPLILDPDEFPFSFTYGGKPSGELLKTWKLTRAAESLDPQRTRHTLTFTDPATGLELRCVAIEYHDFPTVEWTLYFKNTGTADTPILENIQALDLRLERCDRSEFLLHHNTGSPANGSDYGLLETRLEPGSTTRLSAAGGRPSNTDMPYFNIASSDYDGLIAVVGWPGQWAAEFKRDGAKLLGLRAGQELTHFKLLSGEEVRSPLVVLQFWSGDWIRAQNIWRRWMMAHSMPKPGGELPEPTMFASSSRAYEEMIKADSASQIMFIDRFLEEKLGLDYWWMDAGWYVQEKGWPQVGTWEVDQKRFPGGLRPISDHAHANGIKILVWFEPERVAAGTWLADNHPEWIFGGKAGGLLNLGNDEARNWLTEHIDTLITEQGIDLYRQDFNMDPLSYWCGNDAEDRQGITEIRHVTGYLAYWDELRRRHPNMLIDTCASGGRRLDLETARRAVPLWRSDYAFEPVGHQGMTYGISFWLPYHGTGTVACVNAGYYGDGKTPVEPYAFWSNAVPGFGCGFDMRVRDLDYDMLRKLFAAWRQVSPNYYGDYYPLTQYSLDKDAWIGWQFDRPETGEGMVQVFRRAGSIFTAAALPLLALNTDATYVFTDVTTGAASEFRGADLLGTGLPVTMTERPQALVFTYKRKP